MQNLEPEPRKDREPHLIAYKNVSPIERDAIHARRGPGRGRKQHVCALIEGKDQAALQPVVHFDLEVELGRSQGQAVRRRAYSAEGVEEVGLGDEDEVVGEQLRQTLERLDARILEDEEPVVPDEARSEGIEIDRRGGERDEQEERRGETPGRFDRPGVPGRAALPAQGTRRSSSSPANPKPQRISPSLRRNAPLRFS